MINYQSGDKSYFFAKKDKYLLKRLTFLHLKTFHLLPPDSYRDAFHLKQKPIFAEWVYLSGILSLTGKF
jgi:hypothetical protein